MAEDFRISLKSIRELLYGDKHSFIVSDQNYDWTESGCEEFFDGIYSLFSKVSRPVPDGICFTSDYGNKRLLGLMRVSEENENKKKVVFGNNSLVSLMLLLRDPLEEYEKAMFFRILNGCVFLYAETDTEETCKVYLFGFNWSENSRKTRWT